LKVDRKPNLLTDSILNNTDRPVTLSNTAYPNSETWGNLVTHWQGDNEEVAAYCDNMNIVSITAYPGHMGLSRDWTGDYPQMMSNRNLEQ